MYFHKLPHPDNFRFAERHDNGVLTVGDERLPIHVSTDLESTAHLSIEPSIEQADEVRPSRQRWEQFPREATLDYQPAEHATPLLRFDDTAALEFCSPDGTTLLQSQPKRCFGVAGGAWAFDFIPDPDLRFYGMGEKWGALDQTGKKTQFWNTDVMADFDPRVWRDGDVDPVYASIPYLICRKGTTFFGILVDNPYAVFMCTGAGFEIAKAPDDQTPAFFVGSRQGAPSLYFIIGPTLRALTTKLQRLVGVTPRPPLWALGHHQSRWGYACRDDLLELAETFARLEIPNDGLWLDIDYMDHFKVFSFSNEHFPSPAADIALVRQQGAHVVPIVDPGVKVERGYPVYETGLTEGHFCASTEGVPFTGFVWPGKTHFPDFSRAQTKDWWANLTQGFATSGISGVWIDMNDPSVGGVDFDAMRFDAGRLSHAAYHNQYALGMARATREGLLRQSPNARPFVLTRSASTGMARYAAVWTGDNVSNEAFLRQTIAVTLNLALSGIPFNGADVPGFAGDADDDLMVRWYKACFLFPFLRNHSCTGTRRQEPWAFSNQTLQTVRRLIRLRYKLLPYLYQSFIEQECTGEAILRPVGYEFEDVDLDDDTFLVGPSLLQAPLLRRDARTRRLTLPPGAWLGLHDARWREGPDDISLAESVDSTPLFVCDQSVVPMQLGERTNNDNDLSDIELHVFLASHCASSSEPSDKHIAFSYELDDGRTFAYQQGERTRIQGTFSLHEHELRMELEESVWGSGPLAVRLVVHCPNHPRHVEVVNGELRERFELAPGQVALMGALLDVRTSSRFVLGPGQRITAG